MSIVITGMHRSGTSMLARLADAAGLSAGNGPIMSAAADNQRGFFERRDVAEFNDEWLTRLGGAWWAPPGTTASAWRSLDPQRLSEDRIALDLFDPDAPAWFVKDPRISLLLPLWDRLALQALPTVIAIRDPREVASSLHLRDGIGHRRGLALWFAYTASALRSAADRAHVVLDYDSFLADPERGVSGFVEFISAQGVHLRVRTSDLVDLVEQGLRRNVETSLRGVSRAEVDEALDAYAHLVKRHAMLDKPLEEWPSLPEWVDEALAELAELYAAQRISAASAHDEVALRAALELAEAESEDLRTRQLDLETALHDALGMLEGREQELGTKVRELRLALGKEREEAAQAAQERTDLLRRINELKLSLEPLRIAERELKAALADRVSSYDLLLSQSSADAAVLRTEIERLVADGDALRSALAVREAEAAVLRDGERVARARLADSDARIQSLELDLEGVRASLERSLDDGDATSAQLLEALTRLSALDRALDHLSRQLEESRAAAAQASETARARLSSIEALTTERSVMQFERANLMNLLQSVIRERDQAQAEIAIIRSSRSYRYGRRLTAPVRALRGERPPPGAGS